MLQGLWMVLNRRKDKQSKLETPSMNQCATLAIPVRNSCCPHVTKLESEWRYYLHEANRNRLMGKPDLEKEHLNLALKLNTQITSLLEDIQ